jgi:hypothetical protein
VCQLEHALALSLTKRGIDERVVTNPSRFSSLSLSLSLSLSRTLIANLSAAEKYKKTHFDSEHIQKVLSECAYFYATGFFVTHSTDSLVAMGEHANKNGKTFLFNLV